MTTQSLRILVLGYVVRGPLAGPTWHHLQYVLGLKALGHDVWYLEDSTDTAFCYDPSREAVGTDARYGLEYIGRVFSRAGVGDRWAYHDAHDDAPLAQGAPGAPRETPGRWHGPAADRALELCRTADVVLNVSGINPMRPWLRDIPRRVLIDTDPVFTQVDHLQDAPQRAFAHSHNAFFTFGERFGLPGCTMPDDGLPWRPTRQPVALDAWASAPGRPDAAFSTVMLWDSYERREWQGRVFGMKAEEMEHVLPLPRRSSQRFEVAVGSPTTPHDRLTGNGWALRNPLELTCDPWIYQDYMRASKAEFSVAKHGYVCTGSGWFSERSCGYLACGRPVVTQETGFSAHLPTGVGLLAWSTPEQALAAVEEVAAHYDKHCSAAREIVATCFDARRVLRDLLERL